MTSPKPLEQKTAIVTGASRGIGFAVARKLGQLGARVAMCARDAKRLSEAAKQLGGEGIHALAIPADVSRARDVEAMVQKADEALGPADVVVNNAGIGFFGPVQEASEETWDSVLDTNLKSAFLMTRACAPGMIRRRSGHIINIASLAGKNAFTGGGIYCASKWGLLGFTYCLAEDLRTHGIRVSAICPGTVATEFSPHSGKDPAKMLQSEDIAHAVETIVTQAPGSFISEILLRPTQKP
jgi:NAD(P)-dependent dehydrogenase (short-subunit alcohol dehydrogenase family)